MRGLAAENVGLKEQYEILKRDLIVCWDESSALKERLNVQAGILSELTETNNLVRLTAQAFKTENAALKARLAALDEFLEMIELFVNKHFAPEYLLKIEGDHVWAEWPITREELFTAIGRPGESGSQAGVTSGT